ncbi:hypothetical protein J1N35_004600, partial [Gossypium stocksii]
MDGADPVEVLLVKRSGEVATPRKRASSSGRKRPWVEEKSQSTEDSNGGRLILCRRGKEPATTRGEIVTSTIPVVSEYSIESSNPAIIESLKVPADSPALFIMSPPAGPSFRTIRTILYASHFYLLQLISPTSE